MKKKPQRMCECTAYKFPHRWGGGSCHRIQEPQEPEYERPDPEPLPHLGNWGIYRHPKDWR
jgi:hypothetical protein